MYSPLKPDEIRVEVERVLAMMGIDHKIGSKSDYEIKCSAMCHLDEKLRIVILDKAGKEIKYRDSEEPDVKRDDAPVRVLAVHFAPVADRYCSSRLPMMLPRAAPTPQRRSR